MISFKDFLKRKEVLNEELQDDFKKLFADKDNGEKAKAVNNWLKNNKKIDFLGKKTDFRIDVAKKINEKLEKLPEDQKINVKDEKEIDEIVTKINNLYKRSKNKKEGNVGKQKSEFVTTLLDNSTEIRSIEPVDVKNVLKCFKKNNINGDTKIDKKEFIETIKEIKKLKELNINKAAVILWLAYFRQCVIGAKGEVNNEVLITGEGALSQSFVNELQKQNTNNNYFDDNSIKDLENIFVEFGKFQMEPSVLINFKNISSAKSFLKKSDEELEKIEGKFTEKTPEEKETEKQEEDAEKAKEEKKADTENQIKDLDAENAKLDRQSDELDKKADALKNDSSSKEEVDLINDIVKKRNWYIFSTKPPKPGKEEELPEFISNIKKEVEEFLNKIGDGLEKFRVNKTSDADLAIKKPKDEQPPTEQSEANASVKEMIKNCIKKNGILVEDNDTFGKEFDRYQEQIEEIKTSTKERIDKILMKLSRKAQNINKDLEKENNYKMAVELQSDFKSLFIEYGYDIASEIERAIKRGNDILKAAKKNKNSDEILGHKTADQKGQEQKDIDRISKILNSTYNKDTMNLARYMLINLLNNLHSSEEVLKQLNKKSFDKEMFDNGYIYSGSSGKVYVPAMPQKTEIKGGMAYSFPLVKTESFKNPASLLNAVGINLSSLSVDVLKGLKETASNLKTEAENYINAAKELYNLIQSTIGNGSTVTEGLFGPKANEDMSNFVKNVNNTNKSNDVLNKICQKINLKNNFEPENNQPDDIALRQFLKGFTLIVIGNDRYVTSVDAFEKNKEQLIGKEEERQPTNQTPQNTNSETTPDEKAKAQSIENNGKVGETYDPDATKQSSSVVTSANADSTYGDGYGYSKKAKAIKKKLNSTTYTYSPNSKLKIVRRTFD